MLSTLDFLIVSHLKSIIYSYHGSENCDKLPCYPKYGYYHASSYCNAWYNTNETIKGCHNVEQCKGLYYNQDSR